MTYNSSKTGAQVDGAVDDVQAAKAASATDTTAGRLLKVGDFGVGGTTSVYQPTDFNNINVDTFFRGNSTAANRPPVEFNYNVLNMAASSSTNTQIAMNWTDVDPQMFFRSQTVTGYSPWRELLHTGNTPIQPNATNLILDSGAKLGIGTTSPDNYIHLVNDNTGFDLTNIADAPMAIKFDEADETVSAGRVMGPIVWRTLDISDDSFVGAGYQTKAYVTALASDNFGSMDLVFGTGPYTGAVAERLRIDASGNLLVGTTSTTGERVQITADTNGAYATRVKHTGTTPQGLLFEFSGASPSNSTSRFLNCFDTVGTKAYLASNGGLANFSANNVNLSDQRAKKDIADSANYLDRLLQIPVRNFRYKDQDADGKHHLGVIAQEVEAVCPEFVNRESFEFNGEKMDSVYNTDLMFAMLKAIQELKTDNDSLRARIEALENKQ